MAAKLCVLFLFLLISILQSAEPRSLFKMSELKPPVITTKPMSPHFRSRAVKLEIENGGFMAPPPLSISIAKKSLVKPIVIILLLMVISTIATALIRMFCKRGEHVGPIRPRSEESEPKPIGEEDGGVNQQVDMSRRNTIYSLFTWIM